MGELERPVNHPSMPGAPSRRRFLALLGAAGAGLLGVPSDLLADSAPRVVRLRHLHTDERLTAEYFAAGRYRPDALADVNRILRDWRTGDVHQIVPELLDTLHALGQALGATQPFEVISGYRSPATNELLRKRGGGGVSSASLHMRGMAIDVRLPDVPLRRLRDGALRLRRGGVGYYPSVDFVHIDTGRVRSW